MAEETKHWFAKSEISSLEYYLDSIKSKLAAIQKTAEEEIQKEQSKLAPLENALKESQQPLGRIEALVPYEFSNHTIRNIGAITSIQDVRRIANSPDIAKRYLEETFQLAKTIQEKNLVKTAANRQLFNKIVNQLTAIGLQRQQKVQKRTRYHTITSPWLTDIQNQFPLNDNAYTEYMDNFRRVKGLIATWEGEIEAAANTQKKIEEETRKRLDAQKAEEDARREEFEKKLQKEFKEKEAQLDKLRKLAYYAVKLNLGSDATPIDIVNKLLSLNKYMKLVHYLNREAIENTTDFEYAKKGIEGFAIQAPEDSEIYSDIMALIKNGENGEVDGNVFMTNMWCISRLRGLVKAEVLKAYDSFISDFASVKA